MSKVYLPLAKEKKCFIGQKKNVSICTFYKKYIVQLTRQTSGLVSGATKQSLIIIIIIIYNLYRGKAPVTGSDFQGGPLRVKIKYTKAKNIQYN